MAQETFYKSEIVNINSMRPWPRNYMEHSERQLDSLQSSLGEFGQFKNIIAWKGFIVAGHGLVEAARLKGWQRIEVKQLPEEWTETQVEAVLVADNRLGQLGAANDEKLMAILESVQQDQNIALSTIGYSDTEILELLAKVESANSISTDVDGPVFKEYTESIADDVEMITCPHCGQEFPK